MKTVVIKGKTYKIPDKKISAAYTGACAAHQVIEHEQMFGKDNVNWKKHFNYLYRLIYKNVSRIVKGLPKKMTLSELADRSPANTRYGGL